MTTHTCIHDEAKTKLCYLCSTNFCTECLRVAEDYSHSHMTMAEWRKFCTPLKWSSKPKRTHSHPAY